MKWGLWIVGLAISAIPVVVGVARSPSKIPDLLSLKAYEPFYTELLFFGIALAGITITEAGYLVAEKKSASKTGFGVAVGGLLLLSVVVLSIWYGAAIEARQHSLPPLAYDIQVVLILDASLFALCALLRAAI